MVLVPGGVYEPFFARKARQQGGDLLPPETVTIKSFRLDRTPVTNAQFTGFVTRHPEWRKSGVPSLFAEGHYLGRWPEDLSFGPPEAAQRPVTNVSWFAAEAYCEAQGKVLPTTDQWEYALFDRGRGGDVVRDHILAWYAVPNSADLPIVDDAEMNGYGVAGLIGLVWEWTLDFSSALTGAELRSSGDKNKAQFCGSGSLGAKDATDYAAFMRYSFRASLKASYTTANLGFRCAKEAP